MAENVPLAAGSIVGEYRIRRLIGRGGMGEVYAAEGANAQKVAIKLLHRYSAQSPDIVTRFHREAAIAKRIASPFIAAVLDTGKTEDGRLWIAFERLVGESFDQRLKREKYLSFDEIAPIVDDTLKGLSAAHAAGVVHRDIKPGNLFIERRAEGEERTRVLDFGVSKITSAAGARESTLTTWDATVGSFAYMPPEQMGGAARVDERADLYAVAAVMFRALAGRLPFECRDARQLKSMKLERDPPSLAKTTGETWPALIEKFLAKMLARDRERRYRSAKEALSAFRKVRRTVSDSRRRSPPEGSVEEDPATEVSTGSFTDPGD